MLQLRVKVAVGVWRGLGLDDIISNDGFVLGVTKPTTVNTGCRIARGSLTVHFGDYIVTTPGVKVSGLLVFGRIIVRAANVTIEDCIVELPFGYTLSSTLNMIDTTHSAARNTTVRFCEVSAEKAPTIWINGIGPKSVTVYRSYIHDVVDGMSVSDSTGNNDPVAIRGSLIDRLLYLTPDSTHSDNRTHNDGIQSQGGPVELLIQGCAIFGLDSPVSTNGGSVSGYTISCIMLNTDASRYKTTVKILDNWLDGGTDTINGRGTNGGTIEVKRNRFGRRRTGYPLTSNITFASTWDIPTAGLDVNRWEDTLAALASSATFTQSSGTQTVRRYF